MRLSSINTDQIFTFQASTDKGNIYCCDVRTNSPVFTLHAHDEAVTGRINQTGKSRGKTEVTSQLSFVSNATQVLL